MQSTITNLSLKNLPTYFLVSFGHCGIDYLHSLLDSHRQLLIMPAFSFYRSWRMINFNFHKSWKMKNCSKIGSPNEVFSLWQKQLERKDGMQIIRRKLFYEDDKRDLFYAKFKGLLYELPKLDHVNIFYALHEAYAFARNIDLTQIRAIVAHEHLSFQMKQILNDFPKAHILQIIRDPRASFAGTFRWMVKYLGHLPDYNFNLITEYWMEAYENWKKFGPKLGARYKIVRNEDLHASLEAEMRRLAAWMGIEFSQTLMESTFSGRRWEGESAYMTKNNKYPQPEEEFFRLENVRARWMKELSTPEIAMIETFTRKSMREFGYDRLTRNNIFQRIYGFFVYILPHRGVFEKWLRQYPKLSEFERVSTRLKNKMIKKAWKHLPNSIKFVSIIMHSVMARIRIYFFPGNREARYI